MPASITVRSCSTFASSRAIRLKPTLTARTSVVLVRSSSRVSYSPSRMRAAAVDRSLSGRLMRPAIIAEPMMVANMAMPTHTNHVLEVSGVTRADSACSQ